MIALLAAAGVALATSSTAPRTVLLLSLQGDAATESLLPALEGQLAGLDVRLEVVPVAIDGRDAASVLAAAAAAAKVRHAALVVWTTPARLGSAEWLLSISDATGERLLVRRLATPEPAAAAELAALLLRTTVASLLEGGTIGVATASAKPALATPPGGDAAGAGVTVGYVVGGLAEALPLTHALAVSAWGHVDDAYRVRLDYRLFQPRERVGRAARITFADQRLTATVERAGVLDIALGVGVSAARQRTASTTTGVAASASSLALLPFLAPEVAISIARLGGLEAKVAIGVDCFVNPRRYAVDSGTGARTLLAPWPAQPWARVTLAATPMERARSPRSDSIVADH